MEQFPFTWLMFKAHDISKGFAIRKDMDAVVLHVPRVVFVSARGPRPAAANPVTHKVVVGPEVKTGNDWTATWMEVALTPEEIANAARMTAEELAEATVKADAFVKSLVGMTVEEAKTYVNQNVNTDAASLRKMFRNLIGIILVLAQRDFRE
ncbi:MAG: hypothetical protein GY938_31010 [Ketobacter sp.]|nr:hypothetical protein [Ketobacter sp.]